MFDEGQKVVPMESIGSTGHEPILMEKSMFYSLEKGKSSPMLDEGVESHSNGINRIHWRRADSDGKVHDLFVRLLEKFI